MHIAVGSASSHLSESRETWKQRKGGELTGRVLVSVGKSDGEELSSREIQDFTVKVGEKVKKKKRYAHPLTKNADRADRFWVLKLFNVACGWPPQPIVNQQQQQQHTVPGMAQAREFVNS